MQVEIPENIAIDLDIPDVTSINITIDKIVTNPDLIIRGDGTIKKIIKITQAEYDAITHESTTLYLITG